MPQSDSPFSREQVAYITRNFSVEEDTCQDDPNSKEQFFTLEGLPYQFTNKRKMQIGLAEEAMNYIRMLCKPYPFNLRYAIGEPMWLRFCDAWEETGHRMKALRAI